MFVSVLAVVLWRRKPWLSVGWFWFIGTLVPVIGLVQVGAQSMADRYSYIPCIGLFIVVVWATADFFTTRPNGKFLLAILGGSALLGCALTTSVQISHWRSSGAVFLHAIEVTKNNYVAENALGKFFEQQGDLPRATALYQDAVRIEPRYAVSQYNFGLALIGIGRKEQALEHLAAAAKLDPGNADAQFNLGVFFLQQQRYTNAVGCFEATLKLRPGSAAAHYRLGQALAKSGKTTEAAKHLEETLRLQPDYPGAKAEWEALMATRPDAK